MRKEIPIDKATVPQLRQFAMESLGKEWPQNTGKPEILADVQTMWKQDHIVVEVEDEAPALAAPAAAPDSPSAPAPDIAPQPATASQVPPKAGYVRVLIFTNKDAGGTEPVPIGVNGKVMLVPRGKEHDIPRRYYHALANAVRQERRSAVDAKGNDAGLDPTPVPVMSYPHQVIAHGPYTEEELEAMERAKTGQKRAAAA